MTSLRLTRCIVLLTLAVLLNGCLVRRTVTNGSSVVEQKYVFKRPLQNAD